MASAAKVTLEEELAKIKVENAEQSKLKNKTFMVEQISPKANKIR